MLNLNTYLIVSKHSCKEQETILITSYLEGLNNVQHLSNTNILDFNHCWMELDFFSRMN
jgi:hypothetical protein